MKKTIVISFQKLLKNIAAILLIVVCIFLLFSFKIPHLICKKITVDLLSPQKSISYRFLKNFSLNSHATVYAAMPIEKQTVTYQLASASPISPSASPTPTVASLPEPSLSDNTNSQTIQVKNHTQKSFDTASLLTSPLSYQKNSVGYKVLLVHTHTTECYYPNDRSENADENMIRIGKEFQKVLEENGIKTLHITTVHDIPYTTSYKKSLNSVSKALQEHPSIEVVIDLHRDAIYEENGDKIRPIAKINETEVARVMLVCGTDEGGLPHPNWKENLSFALKVQNDMQNKYPNLARPLDLRKERFNTHTTTKSVIFEIGSNGNSLQEAIYGAKLAATSVANVLNNAD